MKRRLWRGSYMASTRPSAYTQTCAAAVPGAHGLMPNTTATFSSGVNEYIERQKSVFLEELFKLLRIPSVSTLPEHKSDMERAVDFLCDRLRSMGMEHVARLSNGGYPLVYADWLHAPGAPTILCYGHYDVQPPDPLAEWHSPPFEPTLRNGNIYARGASDDKGQMYSQLKAAEAVLRTLGRLPVNVRFLIEGEEEVGGASIDKWVREHARELACDCALISDTAMFAPDLPSLDIGLRGMVYAEVEVHGAAHDLHSGLYGGAAPNPFDALARIVVGLKSASGRVLIPGFYDRVRPPSPEEYEAWRRLPFDAETFRKTEVGAAQLQGEAEYGVLERIWARPTLDVHGMPGGFTGPGSKTVIPARASAKISMRLVPDQTPDEIATAFAAAVTALTPAGYTSEVRILNRADPVLLDTSSRYIQAAVASLERVFGARPVFVRSGGSIPIVALFSSELKVPSIMMGFGLTDDGLHAPNEKFALTSFYGGIRAVADLFLRLGEAG